ncbi:MAG: stage II sporulation protein M [Ruminococcaceae bacterium]|nr:stage II sporulation protein M [Oscillospiraceae bacterium]
MHTSGEWRRNLIRFTVQNGRLLWLLALFLAGVQIGSTVFCTAWQPLGTALAPLLAPTPLGGGFGEAVAHLLGAAAPHFLLLLLLFFLGFSACGAPLSLLVPLFFGAGTGLTAAYHYATGLQGVFYTALLILPHALFVAAALLIACAESVRFSTRLAGQLLPHATLGGGLWQDLKLYLARFLLCGGLLFAAAVLDTVLRMMFIHHFV